MPHVVTCPFCRATSRIRATARLPIRCSCGQVMTDRSAIRELPPQSVLGRGVRYGRALARWLAAGSPVRSDAEVDRLLSTHCQPCQYFTGATCAHPKCGCRVRSADEDGRFGLASPLANKLRMATERCPDGRWPEITAAAPRWLTNQDRAAATLRLASLLPPSISAVAGVSRSGLSSSMQLAELLHLHPFSISLDGDLTPLPHGYRFEGAAVDSGDLLVVDDTLATGASMRRVRARLRQLVKRKKIWFAVIYASTGASHLVDFYSERLELPHYLEWNFFNSVHSPKTALDFDGVLCRDCRSEEDDDGPAYAKFLEEAEPLYLPRRDPVPLIVTARLEKYRPQTEAWLKRWGIRCEQLVMGPWPSLSDRRARYSAREFKGRVFAASSCEIFVESCPRQAKEIAATAGKTVICPSTSEVHVA